MAGTRVQDLSSIAKSKPKAENFRLSVSGMMLGGNSVVVRTKPSQAFTSSEDSSSIVSESDAACHLGDALVKEIEVSSSMESNESNSDDIYEEKCLKKGARAHQVTTDCLKNAKAKKAECKKAECKKKAKPKSKACKKNGTNSSVNGTDSADADESASDPTIEVSSEDNDSSVNNDSEARMSGGLSEPETNVQSDDSNDASDEASASNTEGSNSDASSEKPKKSAAAASSVNSDWSMSEDAFLTSLKTHKEPLSWVEIGHVLGRDKKEAKARWNIIKHLPRKPDSDDDGENDDLGKEDNTEPKNDINNVGPTGDDPHKDPFDSFSDMDPEEEKREQKKYLHAHIWNDLYPPTEPTESEEHFDKDDCAVLAAVHSKYRVGKWLEMQANFYNVTGRLVPLEVFRARCEDFEEQQLRQKARREGQNFLKKVQKWIDETSDETQDDDDKDEETETSS